MSIDKDTLRTILNDRVAKCVERYQLFQQDEELEMQTSSKTFPAGTVSTLFVRAAEPGHAVATIELPDDWERIVRINVVEITFKRDALPAVRAVGSAPLGEERPIIGTGVFKEKRVQWDPPRKVQQSAAS